MKKIFFISMLLFVSSAWSSDDCKKGAQRAVEIREDYKNFAEVEADVTKKMAEASVFTGAERASLVHELKMLRLEAQLVFFHSSGAKGAKLYKITYDSCVAEEKAQTARAAKQAAREAARAARAEKVAE